MRVLHLCPLWYPIAADAPGGIETLLACLIAELGTIGCCSTLLASGDSRVAGKLIPVVHKGLFAQMAAGEALEYAHYEQQQLATALRHAREFDIIHSHIGPPAYHLSALAELESRLLHTQHIPVLPDLEWFVRQQPDIWFSTVSDFQAQKLRRQGATRCTAVHNGIKVTDFPFSAVGGEGLLFIGRIERSKGPDLAVEVARELQLPLDLAGPIVEPHFFEETIKPFLDERIRYVGVVDHAQKCALFGTAGCAILPFRGEEPFGMVSVEAMACGTPVVALASGALPEIVQPGLTGYLADCEQELAPLVFQALRLERAAVRACVSGRFDIAVTARRYREIYSSMLLAPK